MELVSFRVSRWWMTLIGAVVVSLTMLIAGCSDSNDIWADKGSELTAVQGVGPQEFSAAIESGATVVDVRTPEEFADGHIDGAINLDVNSPGFQQRVSELDSGGTYAVYCRSGNRSVVATQLMAEQGFTSMYDLSGGIIFWEDSGFPVV